MANIQFICFSFTFLFCGIVLASPLKDSKECAQGPSYWCTNIRNAKECNAVKHCISAVWEKQAYPVDTDEICQICTDMVQQARDNLESNETQELIKEVFDGSCKLIPIKVVSKECMKLSDEFIPELIETLASQMNPQVVCSVAGLCNNARIDQLLAESKKTEKQSSVEVDKCTGCYSVIDLLRNNFDSASETEVLESSMKVCFKLGSYSDACAANLFKYWDNIYTHIKKNFYPDNVCHVAGTCTERYHQHENKTTNVHITPMGDVGVLTLKDDDVPCKLCQQLVLHLRDIFIANTTEEEFKRVMEGLCKQTGSFKDECTALVDEYYPQLYKFLVGELDPNAICFMAGLCKKGAKVEDVPIAPLVPKESHELLVRIIKPATQGKPLVGHVNVGDQSGLNVRIMKPELSQLPIERMMPELPQSKEICTLCQYFLHYVQVEISDARNEEKIKQVVGEACDKLPSSINTECKGFVSAYGDAVIALLVQEIDPSQVCPILKMCPTEEVVTSIEVLMNSGPTDKPSCPLCLFAVEQLESMLQNNRTEENIKRSLDNLCLHLPAKLKNECVDFVDTYSKQLVETLTAEFTPQEVCVFLKLCADNKPDVSSLHRVSAIDQFHTIRKMSDHNNHKQSLLPSKMLDTFVQVETNVIPDNTYNGKPISLSKEIKDSSTQCVVCEFIMSQIDKQLKDKATDEQIKKIVHGVCNFLPKDVGAECNSFVDKYADAVISLLVNDLAPAEVCGALDLCSNAKSKLKNSVLECSVCEQAVDVMEQVLSNPNVDRKMTHIIEKVCYALPGRYVNRCEDLMEFYGESILHLIATFSDSKKICAKVGLCAVEDYTGVQFIANKHKKLLGERKCTWGPGYWCDSEQNAHECGAIDHCREKVWKGEAPAPKEQTPKKVALLGSKKCSRGPGYWCINEHTANECGVMEHCKKEVWKGEPPKLEGGLVGANKCTWGPGYWCTDENTAGECGALEHCRTAVWKSNSPRTRRSTQQVGAKKCSWGPTYWCVTEDSADECRATQYCRERVWLGETPQKKD